jgi:hypothetical protein
MNESGVWWGEGVGNTGGEKKPAALAYTDRAGPVYVGTSTQFYTPVKPLSGTGRVMAHWPAFTSLGDGLPIDPFPGVIPFSLNGVDKAAIPVFLARPVHLSL